jgi:ferredoxin-thioredoxin reductase catalytic chain
MQQPTDKSITAVERLIEGYARKSATTAQPDTALLDAVAFGLARNFDEVGKPLCPCRFYPDKAAEAEFRTWICPCADMQVYKYCHCLLFVRSDGRPITCHLPDAHPGRAAYGLIEDPTPEAGRPLREQAGEREQERRERPS